MLTGSCLCGTVQFQIDGAFDRMTHCHCSMCRKSHGAPFATYATCAASQFAWTAGEDAIMRRESSPGFARTFCRHCGSSLPAASERGVHVPTGCIDGDPGLRPSMHIFSDSAAPWHTIADTLPRHATWEVDSAETPAAQTTKSSTSNDVLRGSCLCGAIAFEVTETFAYVHNCHCSRCRKARAAAHTSNAFTSIAGVRFTRGEDQIQVYKLLEAEFFSVAFCRQCGSGVPKKDVRRDVAVTPMSALDDDPQRPVDRHIFMASKASWYAPQDALPTFDTRPD
ncbi:MAG: hypothetical protein ACI9DC_000203 [Gammaproteobacteria bacterium]|jgi:hypothetical protein